MNALRKYRTPIYRGSARTGMEKKKIIYKTDIQKKSLLDMYMEGVRSSGSTVTAEAAHERMKCKLTNDGLRFYSSTSGNGVLLSVNQIKQYFSTLHKAYTTGGVSDVNHGCVCCDAFTTCPPVHHCLKRLCPSSFLRYCKSADRCFRI